MVKSIRASDKGIQIADNARKNKGLNKSDDWICNQAYISPKTLSRFWSQIRIQIESFVNICNALEVDWEEIAEGKDNLKAVKAILQNLPPFGDLGCIEDPNRFFNRHTLLKTIYKLLKTGVSVSLVGEAEIGKSSILKKIYYEGARYLDLPQKSFIYINMEMLYTPEAFFTALIKSLSLKLDIQSSSFGLDLQEKLQGKRYILGLDEMEVFQDFPPYVLRLLRGLAGSAHSPLTLVTASRSSLYELFPDSPKKSSPIANICRRIDVLGFSEAEARKFLQERLQGTNITFSDSQIEELVKTSQCHPARLQTQASVLYQSLI